jgi:hypothetical protein
MICDYCSIFINDNDVKATIPIVVFFNNKNYDYQITTCNKCWGVLMGKPRDDRDRIKFEGQVELYKIKKYKLPQGISKNKKKETNELNSLRVPVSSIKGKDKF